MCNATHIKLTSGIPIADSQRFTYTWIVPHYSLQNQTSNHQRQHLHWPLANPYLNYSRWRVANKHARESIAQSSDGCAHYEPSLEILLKIGWQTQSFIIVCFDVLATHASHFNWSNLATFCVRLNTQCITIWLLPWPNVLARILFGFCFSTFGDCDRAIVNCNCSTDKLLCWFSIICFVRNISQWKAHMFTMTKWLWFFDLLSQLSIPHVTIDVKSFTRSMF